MARLKKMSTISIQQKVIRILYFDQWLIHNYPQLNFFEIDLRIAKNFLNQASPKYRDYEHGSLRQFFRWCLIEKFAPKTHLKR